MEPRETVERFDRFLTERGLSLDAIVIGGTALGLLGIVSRQTRDCDILTPRLSSDVIHAANSFAAALRNAGQALDDDWLNNGPSTLADSLPAGWETRLQVAYQGTAITLRCLGRIELIMSKVFALCDRGLDIQDCIALAPTPDELVRITPWLEEQDGHPDWPVHVRATLDDLRGRLRHGL